MVASFEQGVWEECGVSHPAVELQRKEQQLRDERQKKEQARRQILRTVTRGLGAEAKGWGSEKICTSVGIKGDMEALLEERSLMEMARKGRLTLLDVEEVRDVLEKHYPSGRMNVHQDSIAFSMMCRQLYDNATKNEIAHIHHILGRVRKRRSNNVVPITYRDGGSRQTYGERTNLYTVADFVIAFGKWLSHQETTDKMKRCSLTTFKLTAVERFTRDLDAASPEATKHMLDNLCKEMPGDGDLLAVNSLHAESLLKLHLSVPASARRNMRRSQAHRGEMPELQELEEDEMEGASAARIEKSLARARHRLAAQHRLAARHRRSSEVGEASLEPGTDPQRDLAKAEPASERFPNLLCDPRAFDGASGAGLGENNDYNGLLGGDSGDSFSSTSDSEDSSLDLDNDDAGIAPAEGAAASKHPLTAEVKPVLMRSLSFSSEFQPVSCLDV